MLMALAVKQFCRFSQLETIFNIRGIMTTGSNFEKALENLQKNPYYEKYAERISSVQKMSPEKFLKQVEQQEKRKQDELRKKFASVDTGKYSSVLNPKGPLNKSSAVEQKQLSAIFKTELVENKESSEIQDIWEEYHKNKDVIAATIPATVYDHILAATHAHPTFLFPLPRDHGYEFILCQGNGHELHFTPLLAFQVHKENAPECLTIVHYPELKEKGIILMRGEYDKKVLSGKEAQCLANQFQLYYSGKDEQKKQLLIKFTQNPDSFKHTDLISELENITLT